MLGFWLYKSAAHTEPCWLLGNEANNCNVNLMNRGGRVFVVSGPELPAGWERLPKYGLLDDGEKIGEVWKKKTNNVLWSWDPGGGGGWGQGQGWKEGTGATVWEGSGTCAVSPFVTSLGMGDVLWPRVESGLSYVGRKMLGMQKILVSTYEWAGRWLLATEHPPWVLGSTFLGYVLTNIVSKEPAISSNAS